MDDDLHLSEISAINSRMLKITSLILLFAIGAPSMADNCGKGRHWVRAYHRRAYYRANGNFVSATNVTAHCQSNSKSYDFWKDKFKTGTPEGWRHHGEVPKAWTEEEKERVFEAFDEIPDELKMKSMTGIYRFKRSDVGDNPSTWEEGGVIAIYDTAFEKQRLARVLAHELAHEYYDRTVGIQDTYESLAGVATFPDPLGRPVYKLRPGGFVEKDGETSFNEDFANNVEYLLFEPNVLQSVTPSVYTWMRNFFGSKFIIRRSK